MNFRQGILDYLASDKSGHGLKRNQFARRLCNNPDEKHAMLQALHELEQEGVVIRNHGGDYSLAKAPASQTEPAAKRRGEVSDETAARGLLEGIISCKDTGIAFVKIPGSDQSVFIPPRCAGNAVSGDIVRVLITAEGDTRGPVGKVVAITGSSIDTVIGVLELRSEGQGLQVRPLRAGIPAVLVAEPVLEEGVTCQLGDFVRVKLMPRRPDLNILSGLIEARLGDGASLSVELDAIIAEYGLQPLWHESEDAIAAKIRARPMKRTDMTDAIVLTIDPKDAKDHDDALSFHPGPGPDEITVGIHIADVAAYVSPTSELFQKVSRRCFTAYLPGRTLPMLPPVLVRKRCSLIEGEEKPAHTVMVTYHKDSGKAIRYERFHSTVKVRKYLYYEQLQQLADAGFEGGDWKPEIRESLKGLYELALKTRVWRQKNEAFIPIDAPEVRVMVDHLRMEIVGLKREAQTEANQMVEEFMLAGNVAVAQEIIAKNSGGLFRVHPAPDEEKSMEFAFTAKAVYGIEVSDLGERENCVAFLAQLHGHPAASSISNDFLRTMQKARYAAEPALHYGLGKELYSHFTSPIRRLSDLLVHQQLWEIDCGRKVVWKQEDLERFARHCSESEMNIDEAYRACMNRFKLHFIAHEQELGRLHQVSAAITKITPRGLRLYNEDLGMYLSCDLASFEDDYYFVAEDSSHMTGKRHGKVIRCGQKMLFELAEPDIGKREVACRPVPWNQQPPLAPLPSFRQQDNPDRDVMNPRQKSSADKPFGKFARAAPAKHARQDDDAKPGAKPDGRSPRKTRELGGNDKPRFKGTDAKPKFKSDDRGERKPFARDERSNDAKPSFKSDDRGERKPFARDDRGSDSKPSFKAEDRGERKPASRADSFKPRAGGKFAAKQEARGEQKPFNRDDDRNSDSKPRFGAKSEDRGERKPFARDDRNSDSKPRFAAKSEDRGERKPFARDESSSDSKPRFGGFAKSEDRGERKPFARDDRSSDSKPRFGGFAKSEDRGERKPFARDDRSSDSKPRFSRDNDRGERKPFAKSEDRGERKPFARDEDRGDSKPAASKSHFSGASGNKAPQFNWRAHARGKAVERKANRIMDSRPEAPEKADEKPQYMKNPWQRSGRKSRRKGQ